MSLPPYFAMSGPVTNARPSFLSSPYLSSPYPIVALSIVALPIVTLLYRRTSCRHPTYRCPIYCCPAYRHPTLSSHHLSSPYPLSDLSRSCYVHRGLAILCVCPSVLVFLFHHLWGSEGELLATWSDPTPERIFNRLREVT